MKILSLKGMYKSSYKVEICINKSVIEEKVSRMTEYGHTFTRMRHLGERNTPNNESICETKEEKLCKN